MAGTKEGARIEINFEAEAQPRLHPLRLALVVGVLATLCFGLWWLKVYGLAGTPIRCLFHQLTGLHCPGCGMTRATSALLDLDVMAAIHSNPLGVILFPIALLGVGLETIGWVRGTTAPWKIPLGKYGAKVIAVLVILFFILRNLPWSPFSLLAPH